ncbi:MAG: sugar phosphate isomerase/epimerase [Bryobacteraceae bacterium]|nr:sugar phosphate isomerase/epimerase [Bryobacteraceae bacterium]
MNRRTFLAAATSAATSAAALAQSGGSDSGRLPIRKAVLESMILPKHLPVAERFQIARDVGFDATECHTEEDPKRAEEIRAAAIKTGMKIHSVMNTDHWKYPLSSGDPQVVAKCMKGMETSLRNAKLWGADTVLLVPAVVGPDTSYQDAWTRSQKQIRQLLPLAEELKVVIAVEEVWNKFLLSPLEFARYVDEFKSPWVKAYFDVGNVVLYGYPQDWILTLGNRIAKLHIKDFRFPNRKTAEWVPLREGEIDWKLVYNALRTTGYKGIATVELPGGDKTYLQEVSKRFDLILSGA